ACKVLDQRVGLANHIVAVELQIIMTEDYVIVRTAPCCVVEVRGMPVWKRGKQQPLVGHAEVNRIERIEHRASFADYPQSCAVLVERRPVAIAVDVKNAIIS